MKKNKWFFTLGTISLILPTIAISASCGKKNEDKNKVENPDKNDQDNTNGSLNTSGSGDSVNPGN